MQNFENQDYRTLSDEQLIERFVERGDEAAFATLYRRYALLVKGVAIKYMEDVGLAEDMVSRVFEKLYTKLATVQVQQFKSYVYTSTKNECIGELRRTNRLRDKQNAYVELEKSRTDFMENEGLTRLMNSPVSIEDKVQSAVDQLPPEQRQCIHLFFFKDKSYKEIEADTQYTPKQVKSYLQNGKRNLRKLLLGTLTD